ncbi:lysoplasmalogenase [Roseivirga sp. UBA1976]|uniref:lysoplasmalogenase n=1 Tax=Roseivirga sp. UBA1976 TaxID=1947386 RepID=UPI002579DB87|nr:lysoplasmalogenase [Roseivirga sp. UBA1976]|tara:strand:- start:3015 stop:3701 length:687 start_codon:yes stop_codon:yes gene_type:complete
MRFNPKATPFFLLSVFHLAALLADWTLVGQITKPLLIPSLFLYFVRTTPKSPLNGYIKAALVFSFLGDTLLIFSGNNAWFFLAGLLSFLLAHVVYLLVNMSAVTVLEKGFKPQWQDIPFMLYGLAMFSVVKPGLGNMYAPALLYTVIICLMAITARKRWKRTGSDSFWLIMAGALFFVLSDSILAYNRFVAQASWGTPAIMATYLTAQFLLIEGYREFILKVKNPEAN